MNNISSYDITLKIENHDISDFLTSFRIINDINDVYTGIILSLSMDFKDYAIDNNFKGKNELVFEIKHKDVENNTIESIGYILGIVETSVSLVNQQIDAYQTTEDNTIKQTISMVTVPLLALNKLGQLVNYISEDGNAITAFETIKDVIKNEEIDVDKLDARGQNPQQLRQVCIPPMSINKMIPFMNQHYGIYDGPMFYYCDHYGKIKMWNIKERYKDNPIGVIHQFTKERTGDNKIADDILKKISDLTKKEYHYMCVEPISTLKHANANIIQYGYNHVSVSHPPYDLYGVSTSNAKELITDTGISGKSPDLTNHRLLENLKRYSTTNSGETIDGVFIRANKSINYLSIAPIRVIISGYCRFSRIINIGNPVELIVYTLAYKQFSGKYILVQSSVDVSRSGNTEWVTSMILTLNRSV